MNDFMKTILHGIKSAFYLKTESDARYFKKEDAEQLIEDNVEELLGDFDPDISFVDINFEGAEIGEASPINADTLGGYSIEDIIEQAGGGGTAGGGNAQFRLIRHIVIPEDITTDNSGVNFAEQSNGGVLFGFDTDKNDKPFSLSELIIFYNAGTTSKGDQLSFAMDSPIPSYGNIYSNTLQTQVYIGVEGKLKQGVCQSTLFDDGHSFGFGATFGGGGINNLQTLAKESQTQGTVYTKIEKMRVWIGNYSGYGLSAGSWFKIYGR